MVQLERDLLLPLQGQRINMLAAIEMLKVQPAGGSSSRTSPATSQSATTSATASSASPSNEQEVDGLHEQLEKLQVDDSKKQVS